MTGPSATPRTRDTSEQTDSCSPLAPALGKRHSPGSKSTSWRQAPPLLHRRPTTHPATISGSELPRLVPRLPAWFSARWVRSTSRSSGSSLDLWSPCQACLSCSRSLRRAWRGPSGCLWSDARSASSEFVGEPDGAALFARPGARGGSTRHVDPSVLADCQTPTGSRTRITVVRPGRGSM